MTHTKTFSYVVATALCLTFALGASAEDWPHWMGKDRNNEWKESGIIDKFPEGGPKVVWRTPINLGYSGPAVVDGKVYITDFKTDADVKIGNFERREFDGSESVICLDASSGEEIWRHTYEVRYTISYPSGPRCTPVVNDGMVYTLGAEGNVFCFNANDGEVVWSKELKKEYNTTTALWGYAGHPLIDGDNLITLAGGQGSHLVALNKKTGEEVWKSLTAPEQGYSPPTIITEGGARQLITLRPDGITSVNPDTGSEHWTMPYTADSGSIIMSPIHFGNYLYVAGYSRKSMLIELDTEKPGAKEVWKNKAREAISPVNVQPYMDHETGILYGVDQGGNMRATQLPDGELLWETTKPISERPAQSGTAFIVKQGDRFWLFNDSGELIIAKLSPEGYEEIDRAKVIEPSNNAFNRPVVWSMPAFANKRAYIRNDDEIICVDLAK